MKASIIVPTYNVLEYLEACLDSLLDQDFPANEYEIIVIDDGSKDGSGEMADRYAARHAEIRVIHQENRGVSVARNVGIAEAKGDYLWFVDPDDAVMPHMLPRMVELMELHQLDKLQFPYVKFEDAEIDAKIAEAKTENARVDPNQLTLFASAYELSLSPQISKWRVVWNYVLRAQVLRENPLRFAESVINNEDGEFNFWLDRLAGKSAYIPWVVYFYRNRSSGMVHSAMSDAHFTRYIAGRIKLAEQRKQAIADFSEGKLMPLRTPVTHQELELRYIHEVMGTIRLLFEKGDAQAFEEAMAEMKERKLYPYPIRLASLRLKGQNPIKRLAAFFFPIEGYLRLCFKVFEKNK